MKNGTESMYHTAHHMKERIIDMENKNFEITQNRELRV